MCQRCTLCTTMCPEWHPSERSYARSSETAQRSGGAGLNVSATLDLTLHESCRLVEETDDVPNLEIIQPSAACSLLNSLDLDHILPIVRAQQV